LVRTVEPLTIMAAREQGHRETFRRLASLFTTERLEQLDSLLVREEWLGRTPLAWLGQAGSGKHFHSDRGGDCTLSQDDQYRRTP
jgi:hypothetical protein